MHHRLLSFRSFNRARNYLAGLAIGAWALGVSAIGHGQRPVDFRSDIKPIFEQYCIECHGPSQQMHGFRLDRRSDAMRGATIPVITPGKSEASRLYLKLAGNQYGPQMPPTGPLSSDQINLIKSWIDQGAEWPDDLSGEKAPKPSDPRAVEVMNALRRGDNLTFKNLVRKNPKLGNLRGPGGTTPLMQAVLYGDPESVRLLLANGADPNLANDAGATALMWAVDDPAKTRILLDHGADVDARSAEGRTPLLNATSRFGDDEVAMRLLRAGANPSARSPILVGFSTPLSEAALAGDESLLRTLIQRGADANSARPRPLLNACKARCAGCFEALMERSDRKTLTGAALATAQLLRDGNIVKEFIEKGVDPNARDPKGDTLLMLAASSDALPVEGIHRLIQAGAEVNARNSDGMTALDFARLNGATPVVDLLVKHGAKDGVTSASPVPLPRPAPSARLALKRSIPLLQKADVGFMQTSGCVSCHNNSLTAMTVSAARRSGFAVDDGISRNQIKKVEAYVESWRDRVLQGVPIPGDADTASYILLGLAAENYPPDSATDALARLLKSRQHQDGHWISSSHRPPLESSDIEVTAASLRSLQAYGLKARSAEWARHPRMMQQVRQIHPQDNHRPARKQR